jgi:hypothetical protein
MLGIILYFLLQFLPAFAQAIPSLDEILKRVGNNIDIFGDTVPDFQCRETATQRTFKKGKVKEEVIESIFRSFSKPQIRKGKQTTELREWIAYNGKQIARSNKKTHREPPVHMSGIYRNLLIMTFSSGVQKSHNYEVAGIETIRGRKALALEFTTIEGQNAVGMMIFKKLWLSKDVGKAWQDPDSMQAIRIERKSLNVPAKINPFIITVDYDRVEIAGKEFWMPKSAHIEVTEKKSGNQEEISVEYADYRKFDVSTDIKYGPMIH